MTTKRIMLRSLVLPAVAVLIGVVWWGFYATSYAELPPEVNRLYAAGALVFFLASLAVISILIFLHIRKTIGVRMAWAYMLLFDISFLSHAIDGYELVSLRTMHHSIQLAKIFLGYITPVLFLLSAVYIAFSSIAVYRKKQSDTEKDQLTMSLIPLFLAILLSAFLPHIISGHVVLPLSFLHTISSIVLAATFLIQWCIRTRRKKVKASVIDKT